MPPATTVSLRELADLSIGTPEVGAVNFTALHTLIVAMLKNLDLQNTRIDFQASSPKPSRSLQSVRSSLGTPHLPAPKEVPKGAPREKRRGVGREPSSALESQVKDLGGQVEDLSKQLKRMDGQVQGIATHVQHFSQASGLDLAVREWPEEQEVGVRALDRVRTGSITKDAAEELSFARVLLQRVDELEKLFKDREKFVQLVSRKLSLVPGAEEVTMVTWEELEQAITDGWRGSQAGSETLMGFSKHRGFTSLTSPEGTLSGASTKQPSIDQALDSASGLGPDQTASGSGGAAHPSDGVTSREQSKVPSGTGRQQQPRARDEAGMPRLHQSSIFQFKSDSDRHRSREKLTSTYPRRDERDACPGPVQQDLTLARDQPSRVPASQSQVHLRPDRRGLEPTGMNQPGLVPASTFPHGVVPLSMGQLGVPPPEMDDRELVPFVMDEQHMLPPSVPGRDQQGLELPSTDQHGLVSVSAYQHGMTLPSADQRSMEPLDMDQRGFVISGMGWQGLVPPSMDQQGLTLPVIDQHGLVLPFTDQHGLVSPGLMPISADQKGFVQPSLEATGFIQPGTQQHDLIQSGRFQHALVQPGAYQPGLVQPGADQRGLVQLGADQRGLVQPGVDQRGLVQPGADQPGLVQPGAGQLGMVQPGIDQQGLVQPQADPRGLVQPGAHPLSLVKPGAYLHDLSQPGTYPRGLVQPGMDRYGLRQPGAYQPGLIAPGTKLRGSSTFQADSTGFISVRPYQHGMVPPGREQHGQVSPLLASQGLASPGIDQRSLVPPETYQQGLMHPSTDQHGPIPPSTGLGSTHPDQQHLASPGPGEHDQVYPDAAQHGCAFSLSDSRDSMYPGYGGPGYLSADQHGQEGLDPNRTQALDRRGIPAQKASGQDVTLFRSPDSVDRVPSEGSEVSNEVLSQRRDSLYKMSSSFPTAVETFRLMGELSSLYVGLKESMKDLDEEEAGQTDLEKIQFLLAQMVKRTIPPELQEQLKTVKTLAKEVWQEKAKVERLQRILEWEGNQEAGKELKAGELRLQLAVLRVTVADIEKELAELRESQDRGKAAMENSVSEASLYLQDQLDKLRMIIDSMLTSSSTLLSMSMAPHKAHTLAPGQIDPEATCPACSLDVSHQVSMLVQRYEQLQDMVNSLAISRPSKKAKLQRQDEELLGRVQSAILQVQGDCEKLNITTSNLIEDHRQKQQDIAMLYQGLEKLEKEKANREHLEMEIDVKADKSALATKVSRIQFDATTEQLNHMMQELVAKMSGQEQDWQKMLDKLLTEMDNKLDRLELDPVKQLLEDRWKSLRQQLRERPPLYQADEAAAMRRQLLAHFHCLSCDRPLETPVTGHAIPVTPAGPGLPGHHSLRPYTVFELEQVRQHSRNLKLGSAFPRGDLAQMEQSVGRLRSMHSKMLMNIEKVQIHFGGSAKASSQIIRELLHTQCLGSPCYKRVTDTADYTYSTVPRHCGGSHTLTHPYHRSRPQHLPRGLYPTEEIQIAMKCDEVDILGLDGHIYKGRMDTRLPGILHKDSSGTSKCKSQQPRPHEHRLPSLGGNGQLPSRPQITQMSAGNTSVSSCQQKDRPSSEGHLSQPNTAHPPSSAAVANTGLERHMDMLPGEGLEEPTRGPKSSTAQ
ncbi:glutamine-rich protein 2 isoform X2 [Symphalangus syndactylus]|uniref:glutamine-rich protein 2 isoform X2 n=1 Tax=Symphalangus syndactylus TaxID=9590 RepID=UPI0024416C53|nr:glutamine-rich protein 2 isoform X2 [Symphalangus syndactylus]